MGDVSHLERLAALAGTDRSPGVRLSAAAAAADILSRHRVGEAAKGLSTRKRNTLTELYRRIDPSVNPGVFSVFGCLDRPSALVAIGGGLRDPRGDVRLGAAVGLLRLCTSLAVANTAKIQKTVVGLLSDGRHKPDALAEIARICAAAGYRSGEDFIRGLVLPGAHGDLVREASAIFEANTEPVRGLWYSDGRDAGETNPASPIGGALALVDERGALVCIDGKWKSVKSFPGTDVRRMHFRKVGAIEAEPAFQTEDRTWYLGGGPGALCEIDGLTSAQQIDWDKLGKSNATARRAVKAVGAHLPDTSAGYRARGLLLARADDRDGAIAALEMAVGLKTVYPDCWSLLGDALWSAGKKAAAKGRYKTFLRKARKRDFPEAYVRAKSRGG